MLHHAASAHGALTKTAAPVSFSRLRAAAPVALSAAAVIAFQAFAPVSAQGAAAVSTPANVPAPSPAAPPPEAAPFPVDDGSSMELFMRLQDGLTVETLLTRAGVHDHEASLAGSLIAGALGEKVPAGTELAVLLGDQGKSGRRPLQQLTLRPALETKLVVSRRGSGPLRLRHEDITVDSTPLRFTGRSGPNLYWSMRAGGVPAEAAAEYLDILGRRLDVSRELGPDDRFDLIIGNRRASTGEIHRGPLLYAAIDRLARPDVRMINWSNGARSGWFDANSGAGQSAGMQWPVSGRISSRFGTRVHPILRFARFHSGVDVSAPRGTPIVASADGRVTAAGWNGGHGRQVRVAHDGGLETSYSHMSTMSAAAGMRVRQGQVIGYVGSSGFSTGPHLHYEVRQHGRSVDPLSVRSSTTGTLSPSEVAGLRARLRQLLAVDGSRLASVGRAAAAS